MLKDRGEERGDVEGPLEWSLTLAVVARDTRMKVATLQRQGTLPWVASYGKEVAATCEDLRRAR